MPKKFDTNPLDPNFPEKARAAQDPEVEAYFARETPYTPPPAATYTPPTPYSTAEFPVRPPSVTEDETQRFTDAQFNTYAYQGGQAAAVYQPMPVTEMDRSGNRKESRTGVPEKWLIGLPYIPFSIGLVAGLILLLVIPKEENKVRFHAAQGLAAHVGILIVTTILEVVRNVTDLASLGLTVFTGITTVLLIIFAIKAWRGKPIHIEAVDELTNWLEDKIGPMKSS